MFNNTKRTRSQLALPDFNFELLSRSPLKDARIALRTNINTASVEDHLDMEGELEVDAIPTRQAKRPFSPLKDPLAPRERVLKKPKWDTSDVENETASHILKSFPKKPSSISSEPSPKSTFTAPSHRRAKSVPVERYTPIRHLDLKRLSPSPWRSPSKSKQKLKIATFPSMETIQDNMLAESSKPSASQVAETAASAELSDGGPSRTPPVHEDVNMSSPPLSPPPTSPSELISPPHSQLRSTPPSLSELSFSRPPSPLTPLPPTPRPTKIPSYPTGNVSRQTVLSGDGESLYPPSQPKTPFSASRLPKLSFAVSSRPSASNTSKTKIKTTLQSKPRTRTNKPKPVIALGGRVTRSSSLRQKEASAVEEIPTSAPTAGTTDASEVSVTQPTPGSSQASVAPKGPSSRKRSTSLSYAKPTASSAAKYAPSSPTKPHSVATSSHAPSHTFFASRASQPPASSSLSSLSIALAKLDVPRPTRPNTSLGFNRDLCGELLKEKSSVTSQDDTNVGKHRGTASSVSRPLPLKRASTVGSMGTPQSSTVPNRQSELMLPPPVPQVKQSAGSNGGVHESTEQSVPKKINLRSGIVVGKPKGNISFGTRQPAGSNSTLRAFGAGALNGLTKGRVIHRASRQTSLPTVEGSPVKGGVKIPNNSSKEAQDDVVDVVCVPKESEDDNVFLDKPSEPQDDETSQNDLDIILATSDSGKGKGKEKILVPWDVAASRRASMASHLLSQSLSALPQTPARAPPPERRVGLRPGLRSSSSTYPSSSKEGAQTAPGALGGGIGTSNGAHVSAHGKSPADVSPPGSTDSKRGSLKVLKSCKIYVDVRTDEGDDAGGLFVEMLKGLGAKLLSRVGQTCTHIIWKNGLSSTQARYRMMQDPKPLVVGIAWVVDCVEKRTRVDEAKFLVDLELVNVAGVTKRRRSMLPKHLSTTLDPLPNASPSGSTSGDRSNQSFESSDHSRDISLLDSIPATPEDNLPPLERARRRRANFFTPRT